jgi:plasmid stabilization system protein ParE
VDVDAKYLVTITDTARIEAERYTDFILANSNDSAASDQWWDGLLDAILSLETFPARCPFIAEESGLERQVRQLLYESHRLLFHIQPGIVRILRVYHASRKPMTSRALRGALRG